MELTIKNISGKETAKKVSLNKEIYGIEPNDHAIYLDVKQHLANKRQGTHKTLEKGEITGSTRKLRKQKGSGMARIGSIKSPLLKGGGRVFGPKPRDYGFKLNKKTKQLARKSALTYKAKEGCIHVLEDFNIELPKTSEFKAILDNLNVSGKKTLLVLGETNKNIYLSSRNLPKSSVLTCSELNTYDILNADNIVLSASSVAKIDEQLS
ncbi:MAG: 50S ribosomal protein L4 [Vicingaceae bacterium]